jgi:hypothetical protein
MAALARSGACGHGAVLFASSAAWIANERLGQVRTRTDCAPTGEGKFIEPIRTLGDALHGESRVQPPVGRTSGFRVDRCCRSRFHARIEA